MVAHKFSVTPFYNVHTILDIPTPYAYTILHTTKYE